MLEEITVVALKDTPHELLHDTYVNYKFKDSRGLSQPVIKDYCDVTSVKYTFDELYMGIISSSTGWNLMCNLKVDVTDGQSYFCFDKCKIPFCNTLFKDPFPISAIIWGEKPYLLVEMTKPGNVTIQFDRVYSDNDLGNKIMTVSKYVIPIEEEKIVIEYGTLTKFEG